MVADKKKKEKFNGMAMASKCEEPKRKKPKVKKKKKKVMHKTLAATTMKQPVEQHCQCKKKSLGHINGQSPQTTKVKSNLSSGF